MELALSLGDHNTRPKPCLSFLDEKLPSTSSSSNINNNNKMMMMKMQQQQVHVSPTSISTNDDVVGFCMALGGGVTAVSADNSCSDAAVAAPDHHLLKNEDDDNDDDENRGSSDPPPNLNLHLLPFSPPPVVHTSPPPTLLRSFPWVTHNSLLPVASAVGGGVVGGCITKIGKKEEEIVHVQQPRDYSMYNNLVMYNNKNNNDNNRSLLCISNTNNLNTNINMNMMKRKNEILLMETVVETGGGTGYGVSASDNDEEEEDRDFMNDTSNNNNNNMRINGGDRGGCRKKLRLTKDQSAFLEDSFKLHTTLNPKQKQALAKQLNLRPRQVEVWFQNRRARTKLKQTEIDCEYLKRCCDKLTEENRKLQKELQELRALKSSQPFYMQLPATTLTMCPSCERVVAATTTTTTPPLPATSVDGCINGTRVVIAKPIRAIPFSPSDSLIGDQST